MKKINLRFPIVIFMIILAAASRFLPHPANFAPIGAMALFGAAYFSKKIWAFVIPIVTMWLSDLVMTNVVFDYSESFIWFYQGSFFTYASFALIALFGILVLKKVKVQNVVLGSLGASVIFFIVSNFGVWFSTPMYPNTFSGLIACYVAGLPFFKMTILGDMVYCGIMFGIFELAQARISSLRLQTKSLNK